MLRTTRSLSRLVTSRPLPLPTYTMPSLMMSVTPYRFFYSYYTDRQGNIIPIIRRTVTNPIKFLPQQYTVFQERFGKCVGTTNYHQDQSSSFSPKIYTAGLNVFTPWINNLVYVSNTENVFAVTHQATITKDNASAKVNGVFYYKITDAYKAAYGTSDLLRSLSIIVENNLREAIGGMDLDVVLKGREEINKKLMQVVGPAGKNWGVEVTRVEINEIMPEYKLVNAMDQQMIAERERRATELLAEGKKKATILAAEAKKQEAIQDSEAKLQAAKNDAEGRKALADAIAYSKEKEAEGESKAIQTVSNAIQQNPEIQRFLIAKETAAAFNKLAGSSNNKLLLFPSGQTSIATPTALAAELLEGWGVVKKTP